MPEVEGGVLAANNEERSERVSFTHGDGYEAIPKKKGVFGCGGRV